MKIEKKEEEEEEKKGGGIINQSEFSLSLSYFLPDYFVHVVRAGAAAAQPVGGRKNKGRFKTS